MSSALAYRNRNAGLTEEEFVGEAPIWQTEDTVCLLKKDLSGLPGAETFRSAALDLMRALRPPLRARVIIKPNVVWKMPADSGVITHPAFIGGLIDALLERGLSASDIVVAEGGGIEDDHDMAEIFAIAGYTDEVSSRGVELRDLNGDRRACPPRYSCRTHYRERRVYRHQCRQTEDA